MYQRWCTAVLLFIVFMHILLNIIHSFGTIYTSCIVKIPKQCIAGHCTDALSDALACFDISLETQSHALKILNLSHYAGYHE